MVKCEAHKRNHSRGKPKDEQTNRCYGTFDNAEDIVTDEKYPRSIINISNKVQGNIHPTQKPVELISWLVRTYTNEGDTVLDNCSGSGTTAISCLSENRHFICIEKDPTYWEKSIERVNNFKNTL